MARPEGKILICRAVNLPGYVVPGSLPMKCHKCNRAVWVSPASLLLLHDNPKMQIECIPCASVHIASHGGIVEGLTQAQREEVEEYLNRGVPND